MANERRLVDANAFQWEKDPCGGEICSKVLFLGVRSGKTLAAVKVALRRMLDNAPTVDAVEVVRCKDCKHCKVCYPEKQIDKEATQGWFCKEHKSYRKPDDFCSYGERRADD